MKILAPGLVLVLAAPFLDRLAHAPVRGAEVARRFERRFELALEDVSVSYLVDGTEQPAGELNAGDETRTERADARLTDTYVEVEDGRPLKLVRRIEDAQTLASSVETSPEGVRKEHAQSAKSRLAGARVRFTWDAASASYTAGFDDDAAERDEALLRGLSARVDLAAFLPAAEVAAGDSWEVEASALAVLFRPGGDLALAPEEPESTGETGGSPFDLDAPQRAAYDSQLAQNLAGTLRAEYLGAREVDGEQVALIRLAGEVETSAEVSRTLEQEGGGPKVEQSFAYRLELAGSLAWAADGLARSLELTGDVELEHAIVQTAEQRGAQHEFRITRTYAGEAALAMQRE